MYKVLNKTLEAYHISKNDIVIEKELHGASWNNDLHYKIRADEKHYSARFMKKDRSPNTVFGNLTDEILREQIRFCAYLTSNGIPFMNHVSLSEGSPFHVLEWEGESYRFILFEWIDGEHITCCDEEMAEKFGVMARRIHDVSRTFNSEVFQQKSHLEGYQLWVNSLRDKMSASTLSETGKKRLDEYLALTEEHLMKASAERYDFIVQSDLNPLNVLWNEQRKVQGIVDFESIGYSDKVEGLAWLIKWYSRTDGINSAEMSPKVAKGFLRGYQADDWVTKEVYTRLRSLIWLSGCINWNFVKRTEKLLETGEEELLLEQIDAYLERGEKLLQLI